MQPGEVRVTVPGGRRTANGLRREFRLRPLSAAEQIELFDDSPRTASPARTATVLLARCLETSEQVAAELTVGDREALLLHLRRLMFGDLAPCVLKCPRAECGEKMDLDLRLSDLLLPPYPEPHSLHEAVVADPEPDVTWAVRFRLPNGSDQEEAAALVRHDEQRAAGLILGRCVQRAERNGVAVNEIPTEVTRRLEELMEALDPQAEIVLRPRCPACGGVFQTTFDTAAYFFVELAAHARALLWEVHLLASCYHWSEQAILALPEPRRRRYLDLAAASLGTRALP
jgi:hypothetical protein